MGRPLIDLTGGQFGSWSVLRRAASNKGTGAAWTCRCACGAEADVAGSSLRGGVSEQCRSCSARKGNTTHGKSKSRAYEIWCGMLRRTTDTSLKAFKNYGGRGISVDPAWLEFEVFYADMGDAPEGMSLERKDNEQGYSRANCVWASRRDQARNRRNNVKFTHQGETLTLGDWAARLGISASTLYSRYAKGWREPERLFAKENQRWSTKTATESASPCTRATA